MFLVGLRHWQIWTCKSCFVPNYHSRTHRVVHNVPLSFVINRFKYNNMHLTECNNNRWHIWCFMFGLNVVFKSRLNSYCINIFVLHISIELWESFGLILQNLKLVCVIGTVQTYLGFWGKRLNFGITVAEIQPKVWERRRKCGERKCWISATEIPNFLCPILLPEYECVECPKWKEKKNWQTNCGNAIAEIGE